MGPIPVLFGGITQGVEIFSKKEVKRLTNVIETYQKRFPQSRLHLIFRSFPQQVDLAVILFWIFNQAGLSAEESKGGRNYDVVILIEHKRRQAGIIVGYGLEPILSQEAIEEVVSRARTMLSDGEFFAAFETMVETLSGYLREVSEGLSEAVGLNVQLADEVSDDY